MSLRVVLVTGVILAAAGCASTDGTDDTEPSAAPSRTISTAASPTPTPTAEFPGRQWRRGSAPGADFAALDAALERAGSTCVAVVKDGRLVHDASWGGTDPRTPCRTFSITKSLTALLVGMYAADGVYDLDDPASEQVDEWRTGAAGAITIHDLLAMTSGRAWSDATDRQMIRDVADKTTYAVNLPQEAAPGDRWVYDNAAVQALESVLDDVDGSDDVVANAERRLLDPLGMRDTTWPRDAVGNATTYSGVESTCQDLARVGHLMLNDGSWSGKQLIPSGFVEQATSPSSELNAAYGLLWWTNAEGRVVEVLRQAGFPADKPPYDGRLAPNVPADAYWAFGYGNQYIAVVPSEGVVAVRLGARPASPDLVTFDSFTAGVLDALG